MSLSIANSDVHASKCSGEPETTGTRGTEYNHNQESRQRGLVAIDKETSHKQDTSSVETIAIEESLHHTEVSWNSPSQTLVETTATTPTVELVRKVFKCQIFQTSPPLPWKKSSCRQIPAVVRLGGDVHQTAHRYAESDTTQNALDALGAQ
jgi:hypothetical protein